MEEPSKPAATSRPHSEPPHSSPANNPANEAGGSRLRLPAAAHGVPSSDSYQHEEIVGLVSSFARRLTGGRRTTSPELISTTHPYVTLGTPVKG